MAKQKLSKDELIAKRMRAERFKTDVALFGADLQENKVALDAAMQFIAALQEIVDWCNMKLGEQIRD